MSFSMLPIAAALLAASSLPVAMAVGETCTKDSLGIEHCEVNASNTVKLAVGFSCLGLLLIGGLIWFFVSRRRSRRADAAASTLAYANQPSTYDPNANMQYPAQSQSYPFNGYGGQQQQAPPPPTYASYPAPQGPPPMMQKEMV